MVEGTVARHGLALGVLGEFGCWLLLLALCGWLWGRVWEVVHARL